MRPWGPTSPIWLFCRLRLRGSWALAQWSPILAHLLQDSLSHVGLSARLALPQPMADAQARALSPQRPGRLLCLFWGASPETQSTSAPHYNDHQRPYPPSASQVSPLCLLHSWTSLPQWGACAQLRRPGGGGVGWINHTVPWAQGS